MRPYGIQDQVRLSKCVCVCQGAFASPTGFHRAGKLVKDNKLILPVELREKGALLRA